jgi:hypothetical protein
MAELTNHGKRAACWCGPPPEQCVTDGEVLTQHGWHGSSFRAQPRIERELGLSVLRGAISAREATQYVLQGKEPTERQLVKARIRRTTAGELRHAGFAVVHTPGRVLDSAHCTVAWTARPRSA